MESFQVRMFLGQIFKLFKCMCLLIQYNLFNIYRVLKNMKSLLLLLWRYQVEGNKFYYKMLYYQSKEDVNVIVVLEMVLELLFVRVFEVQVRV